MEQASQIWAKEQSDFNTNILLSKAKVILTSISLSYFRKILRNTVISTENTNKLMESNAKGDEKSDVW